MRLFQDGENRAWDVSIDVGTIKRVRTMAGFELLSFVEVKADENGNPSNPVLLLYNDLPKLVDIMWAIIAPEAISRGIGPEDFGRSMKGEALESAFEQLIGGLIDFFPSGRRRVLAAAAMEAGLAIQVDEKTKLELLAPPQANCGATSSRWRAAWAWCRGRLHTATCR